MWILIFSFGKCVRWDLEGVCTRGKLVSLLSHLQSRFIHCKIYFVLSWYFIPFSISIISVSVFVWGSFHPVHAFVPLSLLGDIIHLSISITFFSSFINSPHSCCDPPPPKASPGHWHWPPPHVSEVKLVWFLLHNNRIPGHNPIKQCWVTRHWTILFSRTHIR